MIILKVIISFVGLVLHASEGSLSKCKYYIWQTSRLASVLSLDWHKSVICSLEVVGVVDLCRGSVSVRNAVVCICVFHVTDMGPRWDSEGQPIKAQPRWRQIIYHGSYPLCSITIRHQFFYLKIIVESFGFVYIYFPFSLLVSFIVG